MRRLGEHLPFLLACLAVSVVIRLTVGVGVISGLSMWPSLAPGDIVIYARVLEPVRGSIVVAELPGHGLIVKRVAAAGGEIPEGYTRPVPPGSCFLVGDNTENSYDSRSFGPLPADRIVGRVVIIWPRREDAAPHPDLRVMQPR